MKLYLIPITLTVVVLLFSANVLSAVEGKVDAVREVGGKVNANAEIGKANKVETRKAAARINLVNINGASIEELEKLPGIGNAEAKKIIAGRPFATKAHLASSNIIGRENYERIKTLIIAKQPYREGEKNAALYKKVNK